MSLSATPLEKILQAVNEKYGTSFESWSQLPTAFEVGDTVPSWAAYEKIEMPKSQYFKIQFEGGYVPVKILNDSFGIYVYDGQSNLIICDNEASVIQSAGMSTNTFADNFIPKINQILGKEISRYEALLDRFNPSDSIIGVSEYEFEIGYWSSENWQNAEIIS